MKTYNIHNYPNLRPGGHTLFRNIYHIVFSTKHRHTSLTPIQKIRIRNWLRLKEEELNFKIIIANGYQDHLHILIDAPLNLSISKLVQHLKGYTSKILGNSLFWQTGYYSETIEKTELPWVYKYIRNQYHHHSTNQGIQEDREIIPFPVNIPPKRKKAA